MLTPVCTEPAYAHGFDLESADAHDAHVARGATLMAVPVLGLPAIAVPTGLAERLAGRRADRRPRFREDLCLAAAEAIEARHASPIDLTAPIDPRMRYRAARRSRPDRFEEPVHARPRCPQSCIARAARASCALAARRCCAQTTLRVVKHSDLKILDPIWTTAYITRNHGYMIYDTLFATDANGPDQAADGRQVRRCRADKLTYTITLRDGLLWHDGAPVTAEDCVASIKRWGAKDAMGQKMMSFVKDMPVVDAKTFRIVLNAPTGLVLHGARQAVVERAVHDAEARRRDRSRTRRSPTSRARARSCSSKDEWKPGDKVGLREVRQVQAAREPRVGACRRQGRQGRPRRVARSSPTSRPPSTRCSPARSTSSSSRRTICCRCCARTRTSSWSTGIRSATSTRSASTPPPSRSTTPRCARRCCYAFNQKDFLQAVIGDKQYYKVCKALFVCGTPLASDKGMDGLLESNFAKAQALLKEAGYDGTPIVLLHSTDLQVLTNLAPVAKSLHGEGRLQGRHAVDGLADAWSRAARRRTRRRRAAGTRS